MIAKVTPLIHLPASADVFDYFIGTELAADIRPGHLVSIPWRSQKVPGVVLALTEKQESTQFRARPVDALIESEPVLTLSQLALVKKFSEYYFVTQGSVARIMAPERPTRASTSKPVHYPDIPFSVSPSQLPTLKEAAQIIIPSPLGEGQSLPRTGSGGEGPQLLEIQDISSFVWLLHYLLKHETNQLLVLIPTVEMILAIAGSMQKKHSQTVSVVHSGLAKGAYWSEYQKILSGQARIILSTRQGVFLPIQKNSRIIFFDSASDDFKQNEAHPRYDSRVVASLLADSTQSKLLFASSSPSLEPPEPPLTPPLVKGENPVFLPPFTKGRAGVGLKDAILPPARSCELSTLLVDMKNEMQRKDFSIIAGQTLEAIKKTLEHGKKAVVISLREESEKGVSAKAILKILTDELKNCKVSASADNFQVLSATPESLEGLKLSPEKRNLGLLIFASIEPLLAIGDYRSAERVYSRLCHWRMLARELGFEKIILQSYSPESQAIRAFAYGELETFQNEELKNRKALSYPPFSKLIKLSYSPRNPEQRHPELVSGSVLNQIQILKQVQNDVQVAGPFTDSDKRPSLLIKLTNDADLSLLRDLKSDWIIDRDPENVL